MMTIRTDKTRKEIKRVLLLLCEGTKRYTQLVICRHTGGIRYSGKVIDILCDLSGR